MRVEPLDASLSRPRQGGPSFSRRNRLYRAVWRLAWLLLAAWTPPFARGWRRGLLRAFGATMQGSADVRASARIWFPRHLTMGDSSVLAGGVTCYNMATVTIGEGTVVSQGAHLCCGSHELEDPHFQLVAKPIRIGRHCWIAAEAFVGPGVTVGDRAVLGARSVAFADLEAGGVYVGNPARKIRERG